MELANYLLVTITWRMTDAKISRDAKSEEILWWSAGYLHDLKVSLLRLIAWGRAQHHFCSILVRRYNLNVIMKKHQTNPNGKNTLLKKKVRWRSGVLQKCHCRETKETKETLKISCITLSQTGSYTRGKKAIKIILDQIIKLEHE